MQGKWKKYIIMAFVGVFISTVIDILIPFENENHNRLFDAALSILLTIIIWEGNLYLDHWFNKRLPWLEKPGKRVLAQFPAGMLFSAATIYLVMMTYNDYVCSLPPEFKSTLFITSVVIGTLFSLILLGIEISYQFYIQWRKSIIEVEKYKTESLQAQLQNLKNQINPHFLFNNMSVLSSLVYKDQDKAVDFINQLSKVYRYLLDNRDNELVTLENELNFIESYNYLIQIRFDTSIQFKIEIDAIYLNKLIPPMALQMLIENAIKHNEISSEQPLTVNVYILENKLVVSNNKQLRSNHEPSSKTGLQNIKDRYKHFTNGEVEIIESEKHFVVKLPLLNL